MEGGSLMDPVDIKSIETDVLVVGGGMAAAFAAVKARETGARVTLVDKAHFGRSGCSALASGVMRAYFPGDDLELWIANSGGGATTRHFVNDDLLRKATLLSAQIVSELEEWGVRWLKHAGKFERLGSVDVGSGPANVMMEGGGPAMMLAVRAEVIRRGVDVINRVMINDLLTADGQDFTGSDVVGAVGMDTRVGHVYVFNARTVVMATGPMMVPYHQRSGPGRGRGMPIDLSGDGHAAMLRIGATMGKLELGSSAIVPWHLFAAPGLEMLMAVGGPEIFVNSKDERFMVGGDINRDMRARSAVGVSILREMREGRGPVYVDLTHLTADQFRLLNIVIPIVMRNFEAVGFDPARDRMPYSVVVMSTHSVGGGGATIDEKMATTVPRLFAAGNCTDGAYMSMQQNLTDCAAMGYWAGTNAGNLANELELLPPVENQVQSKIASLLAPASREGGLSYPELRDRVHDLYATTMGMTFDAERGERILDALNSLLYEHYPRAVAENPREICRIHGVRNFAETLWAVTTAILHRTESRGNVLREDYPDIDNEHWLRFTRLKMTDIGRLDVWDDPMTKPLEAPATITTHPFFAEAQS
jgi:adenylylsulfate reductase, subunit A